MFNEKGTTMLMLMSLLLGCNSKMDEATVKGVVERAFMEQNPTEGINNNIFTIWQMNNSIRASQLIPLIFKRLL